MSSATGCSSRSRPGLVAAFDHRHVMIDPHSGSGGLLPRARAALPYGALLVGGLRPHGAIDRRDDRVAGRQVGRTVAGGQGCAGARPRDPRARRRESHSRSAHGTRRPALERRRRYLREGGLGEPRRRRRHSERRGEDQRRPAPRQGGRRGWQPRLHPGWPGRVRSPRRAHQHGRARQLRRGQPFGPRGQPQDPPERGDQRGEAGARGEKPAAGAPERYGGSARRPMAARRDARLYRSTNTGRGGGWTTIGL